MLYAALVPLLPFYREELGLSKTAVGIVVAAYAAGALVGSLPSGLAVGRFGSRGTVLAGLGLTVVASVGFGFADAAATLVAARLVQGFGSALSWSGALSWLVAATPVERRGEMLGGAVGSAIFGALLGPAVGAVASATGTEAAFVAVAAISLGLAGWTARQPGVRAERQSLAAALGATRGGELRIALWLMLLPSFLFGVVAVLVPLRLDDAGWGAAAIGAVFVVAAVFEMALSPVLGRVSDQVGRLAPLRFAVAASALVSLALAWTDLAAFVALLAVAAGMAFGAFWAPAMALLSDGADRAGLAQGLAFGLMNGAWATGNVVGPALAGALADASGDAVPFVIAAGACAATGILLLIAGPNAGTQTGRVPEGP